MRKCRGHGRSRPAPQGPGTLHKDKEGACVPESPGACKNICINNKAHRGSSALFFCGGNGTGSRSAGGRNGTRSRSAGGMVPAAAGQGEWYRQLQCGQKIRPLKQQRGLRGRPERVRGAGTGAVPVPGRCLPGVIPGMRLLAAVKKARPQACFYCQFKPGTLSGSDVLAAGYHQASA